jgi:peptide/nickel transport system substrate-binding protein
VYGTGRDLDTLVVAYPGAPDTLDPALAYSNQDAAVLRGMYESLVRMKGTSTTQVEGVLATSWTATPQQTSGTFQLRHGALFHDGTPFNAAAVKCSILRTIALNGGPSSIMGQYLDAAGITILGPYTISFI